jgi:hypothetical protein
MHPPHRVLSLLIFLTLASSCSKNKNPITIDKLVEDASAYNGQIVTVSGCYFVGFEMEVLATCKTNPDPNWQEKAIWVEHYSLMEEQMKWFREHGMKGENPFKKPEAEISDKDQQMESRLSGSPKAVVVLGEFQSSSSPNFGHLGKYRYQFILHHVLRIAPHPDPSLGEARP